MSHSDTKRDQNAHHVEKAVRKAGGGIEADRAAKWAWWGGVAMLSTYTYVNRHKTRKSRYLFGEIVFSTISRQWPRRISKSFLIKRTSDCRIRSGRRLKGHDKTPFLHFEERDNPQPHHARHCKSALGADQGAPPQPLKRKTQWRPRLIYITEACQRRRPLPPGVRCLYLRHLYYNHMSPANCFCPFRIQIYNLYHAKRRYLL